MKRKKFMLCILLILAMFCSVMPETMVLASEQVQEEKYTGNGFEVLFTVDDAWDDAYNATISIKNTGEETIENWHLSFPLVGRITNIWNAAMVSSEDGQYFIKNAEWNQDIPAGSAVSFGITVQGKVVSAPSEYTLQTTLCLVDDSRYQLTYSVVNDWMDGFTASVTITNVSNTMIEDWKLGFSFGNKISQIWNAVILQEEEGKYVIGNDGYNSNIQSQQSITFGFLCEGRDSAENPARFVLEEYKADGKTSEPEGSETEDSKTENSEIEDSETEDLDEYDESYHNETLTQDNADQYVHIELQPGNTERCVIDDIVLVNDAEGKYEVQWTSSDTKIISDTGKVSRPEKNQSVVMTAIVRGDGRSIEVPFVLDVRAKSEVKVSEIKDYRLEDLGKLNRENEDFETIVNDFGYLQEVYGKYSDFKVDSYESALYALYHVKSAIGITNPFAELVPYRTFVDDTGYTFQFAQTVQGMITFDNIVTVASNAQGETDYLKSGYYPVESELSMIPQISYQEAEEILAKQYGMVTVREENRNKICVINYYGQVDLVWDIRCQLESRQDDFPSGSYHFLVGAADGEVKFHSELSSNAAAMKRVKASGEDLEGIEQDFFVAKETKKPQKYLLKDPLLNITVVRGEGNPENRSEYSEKKIEKRRNQWEPVEVSAMHNMKKVLAFYYSKFKRVSYADNNHIAKKYIYKQKQKLQDGAETKVSLVDEFKNNAEWDIENKKIYIGSGSGESLSCVNASGTKKVNRRGTELKKVSFALCRDILCHEYTHGIIVNDTNLENCIGIPGAVNEAYADIAACFMDGNWQIGEKIGEKRPLRDIKNPKHSFTASEVAGKYYVNPIKNQNLDAGGVHANSTVISHAVYLMKKEGIPESALRDIWYNTIRGSLDSKTNFFSIRNLFITSCRRQKYPAGRKNKYLRIIKKAFSDVNVKKVNAHLGYRQYGMHMDKKLYASSYFCDSLLFQGKVVEADGDSVMGNNKVLSGATVSVKDLTGKEIGSSAVTDLKGRYQINSELGETYVLTFQKQGYQSETLYLSNLNELLQQEYYCDTVELVPEGHSNTEKGLAEGVLYNASTMEAVPGMRMLVRRGMNNIHTEVIGQTETDAAGNYKTGELEAGAYCLEVVGTEDYESTFFNIKIIEGSLLTAQDCYISPVLAQGQMRAVLTWGKLPEDLDSHMFCELSNGGKGHVYFHQEEYSYQNQTICALDVDDVDSYGPETITIYCGKTGWYHYYIHQYSLDGKLESSNASVQVYLPGKAYPSYTFHVPSGKGHYWDVFRFNSATQRMLPINKIESDM